MSSSLARLRASESCPRPFAFQPLPLSPTAPFEPPFFVDPLCRARSLADPFATPNPNLTYFQLHASYLPLDAGLSLRALQQKRLHDRDRELRTSLRKMINVGETPTKDSDAT